MKQTNLNLALALIALSLSIVLALAVFFMKRPAVQIDNPEFAYYQSIVDSLSKANKELYGEVVAIHKLITESTHTRTHTEIIREIQPKNVYITDTSKTVVINNNTYPLIGKDTLSVDSIHITKYQNQIEDSTGTYNITTYTSGIVYEQTLLKKTFTPIVFVHKPDIHAFYAGINVSKPLGVGAEIDYIFNEKYNFSLEVGAFEKEPRLLPYLSVGFKMKL